MAKPIKIAVIPDVQAKPGVRLDHLTWIGKYLADKRPDVIICLGDFADMESLSSYDKGKKSFEGRRYSKDIEVAVRAMEMLLNPIEQARGYKPRRILTYGNHCERILKAIEQDAILEGTISLDDLCYEKLGWETYSFLETVKVAGWHFSHYFPSGIMGRPCTSARRIINTYHVSCVAGHQQGRDVAYAKRGDGKNITAIIAGSCYLHNEDYLTPMANNCWRGIIFLHECQDGQGDEMFVSLNFLKRRYA